MPLLAALSEPHQTALGMLATGLLLATAALFSGTVGRRGVPVVLLFLAIGVMAGSQGLFAWLANGAPDAFSGIEFSDYGIAYRLGTVALVLILFDGGLNTRIAAVRGAVAPALVLATAGVAVTMVIVAALARLVGLPWGLALLLGAVVSSTDAATVFSVLRGGGISLRQRVGATLELESGLNDPLAVILTAVVTTALLAGGSWSPVQLIGEVVLQFVIGAAVGLLVAAATRRILRRRLLAAGLYPVVTLAAAGVAWSTATLTLGSGFLAVYVAGLALGNGPLPYRKGLTRVHDFLAWFAQVGMFLMLGLLVFPGAVLEVWWQGVIIALGLMFIARPVSVWLGLLPFGFQPRETVFMGWLGLRGAVPIVLATWPIMMGVEGGQQVFNLVFFIVGLSALVQGWSARWMTDKLGMRSSDPGPPETTLDMVSTRLLTSRAKSFPVRVDSPVAGSCLRDIIFPVGSAVMLVTRGDDLIAPRGDTVLLPGDHVHVFFRPEHRACMSGLFEPRDIEPDVTHEEPLGT